MKRRFERLRHCAFIAFSVILCLLVGIANVAVAGRAERRAEKEELAANSCCSSCGKEECCTCSRELVTVLQGGGTTLVALIVSLGKWYLIDFHFSKTKIKCLPKASLFKVDQPDNVEYMDKFFKAHESLREFFIECALPDAAAPEQQQHDENQQAQLPGPVDVTNQPDELSKLPGAAGVEDALVLYYSRDSEMKEPQMKSNSGSTALIRDEAEINEHDNIINHSSSSNGSAAAARRGFILRVQDWDAKNRLWKEALLETAGVLPSVEELEPIKSRKTIELIGVAIQALGYLAGIVSRVVAAGAGEGKSRALELSPVEIMSAWISMVLLVQVVVIPQLATFCSKGLFLHLPANKFEKLVEFYEKEKPRQSDIDITFKTICLFVLCLFFLFGLFLILIPSLVYYYYRLPHHILSFSALVLFTLLSGISIIAFVLTLIFPALQVLLTFSAFPGLKQPAGRLASLGPAPGAPPADANSSSNNPPSSSFDYMAIISSIILLLGLLAYALAIADTVLNWHRFDVRDCYISRVVIPHVGS